MTEKSVQILNIDNVHVVAGRGDFFSQRYRVCNATKMSAAIKKNLIAHDLVLHDMFDNGKYCADSSTSILHQFSNISIEIKVSLFHCMCWLLSSTSLFIVFLLWATFKCVCSQCIKLYVNESNMVARIVTCDMCYCLCFYVVVFEGYDRKIWEIFHSSGKGSLILSINIRD